ncbi:MAG TPA: SGNH/GDSL hydrolase family protein [Candidatus Binatia bacterium]
MQVKLSHTNQAIRSHDRLVVVAIGSSSTEGVGASDPAHTYPALLGMELRRRWPKLAVDVINKGVGGEIAVEMVARFQRDVAAYHPQLVVWQTGSNQTLKTQNVDGYSDTLRDGIGRLKAIGTDIVLMDPQFAPRVIARPIHISVVDAIGAVAKETHVGVFHRFAVMRHWISAGQFKLEEVISSDGLHMNDLSYNCIARLLADSLVTAAASVSEPAEHQTR